LEVEVIEMPYVRQATEFPVVYAYGPDSSPQPGVPSGVIHAHAWTESSIFPGTTRRYWVYVPAMYMSSEPAPLMVFQDGWLYLDPDGAYRVGVVMDNLIHRGEMPATVGVFVDPGEPDNRNAEYDPFDDVYATFLLTEILPPVLDSLDITEDPEDWAIGGGSAGGYCAFSAAWHRADRFRRVLSLVGGGPDPALIAQAPTKPLRVFMQSASRDTNWNAPKDNMLAEDLRVAAALAEGGYDFRLVLGDGHHSPAPGNHGATILPDALRWLWRNHE
jgi:enterochelin esterase-like enzyme